MVCAMRKAGVLSILFVVVPLAIAVIAEAQQPTKVPRMGFLSSLSPTVVLDRVEAFRQGLRELGYVEGKNIIIDWGYAQGKKERLPELGAELVPFNVDAIVTGGPAVFRVVKDAIAPIPNVRSVDGASSDNVVR